MSHKVVGKASQVRQGDLFRPDGVTGWRTVQSVSTIENVGGKAGKSAVEVTLNGEVPENPLVQFYGPDEEIEAMRPMLSPYIKELNA